MFPMNQLEHPTMHFIMLHRQKRKVIKGYGRVKLKKIRFIHVTHFFMALDELFSHTSRLFFFVSSLFDKYLMGSERDTHAAKTWRHS